MTNKEIARVLQETADLIKLTGGNEYRARAFSNASRTIEQEEDSVAERAHTGTLRDLPGIGEGLEEDIMEIVENGTFSQHEKLLSRVPPGLTEVLRVKGLGPSRVRTLWQELDITSLDDLESAAEANKLTQIKGFGRKTQQNILEQVQLLRQYLGQYLFAEAYIEAETILDRCRDLPEVVRASLAGGLRRRLEVVERIEIVAAVEDLDPLAKQVEEWFQQVETTVVGDRHVVNGYLKSGLPISLTLVPADRFATELWELTGSQAHCRYFIEKFGTPDVHTSEEELYEDAGLSWIAPELRENEGEFEAARDGDLPELIEVADMQGSIHNHTTYSDGAHTVEEMARAARAMGLSYLVICDHSRSLNIANGLSIERVYDQQEEIEAVNRKLEAEEGPPFRIFRGIESDILGDGSLDYPEEVLDTFDVVVGSIHSRFNMDEREATDRIVTAVRNPYLTILGHPTGRLLLRREGYPVNHRRVIEACAEYDVAIELNANPRRLDIDWRWIRTATEKGIPIAINPDAHSIEELSHVKWGVEAARKGWLTAPQCLNTKPLHAFVEWLNQ